MPPMAPFYSAMSRSTWPASTSPAILWPPRKGGYRPIDGRTWAPTCRSRPCCACSGRRAGRHHESVEAASGGQGLNPNETTKPMRMTARCSRSIRYHAVSSGHPWTTAICGAKPRQRGNGWSEYVGDAVTCPRCLTKLARAAPRSSLTGPFAAPTFPRVLGRPHSQPRSPFRESCNTFLSTDANRSRWRQIRKERLFKRMIRPRVL
jgi:hypothetical protein